MSKNKIDAILEIKRIKYNKSEFQIFDENWLLIHHYPPSQIDVLTRIAAVQCLNEIFGKPANVNRDFDVIFIHSGDYLFRWREKALSTLANSALVSQYAKAQLDLGLDYFFGQDVYRDLSESIKWIRKSAEQGNIDAENVLAGAYNNGTGVTKDPLEAARLWRITAEQGNAVGQRELAGYYWTSEGITKNNVEACKWYTLAASQGDEEAEQGAGDDTRYFQVSVPVQPGNSGGALVDARGNVIGIVSAKLDAATALAASGALPENVNYAVKSSFLLSFLESVPDVEAKLKPPNTADEKFSEAVKSIEKSTVLVLVY